MQSAAGDRPEKHRQNQTILGLKSGKVIGQLPDQVAKIRLF